MHRDRNVEHERVQLHQGSKLPRVRCGYRQENTHSTYAGPTFPTSRTQYFMQKNIIHCDIKPENVVFKELGKSGVKLIDFGSACFSDRKEFTYIQSRYYRSPEIVLMKPYDNKIDVWSLGCLIF